MKNIKLRELLSSPWKPAAAGIFGVLLAVTVLVLSLQPAAAAPGIYKTINFQGKVVNANGTNVADGNYSFRFRIYTSASPTDATNACSANSCQWEETKTLATVNGIFQTNLGSVTSLPGSVDFDSDTLYLGVLFNGDTEMSPRVRLTAVPYAFNADKLGGLDKSGFAQLSPASQQTGFLNVSGNITSGGIMYANTLDSASATLLNVGTTNATGINLNQNTTLAAGRNLTFASGAGNFDQSGSTGTFSTGTGAISLNGDTTIAANKTFTANGVSLIKVDATSAFSVQNSANYNIVNVDTNTGRVGISTGSSALSYSLEVNGDTGITGNLYMGYGATRTIAVATNPGGAGDSLTVKGGDAGLGNNNGGNVVLTGGLGSGTGARGVVLLDTPAFTTTMNDSGCFTGGTLIGISSCTISANSVNNTSAIIIGFTSGTTNPSATLPDPANTTPGRIVYVTGANGTKDFTLIVNGGGVGNQIAMRQNTSATMLWNGSDWTAAGASSSTTLQAAYDNTLASAGGAEIILNNTATSNGLTIRNAQTNPVMGSVFEVQSSIGTNYLSVNSNAVEYVANGGAESEGSFGTDWVSIGAGTVNRYTTSSTYYATGQASAEINTAAALNAGVRVRIASNLATNTQYQVSFTGRSLAAFSGLTVSYSRDGGGSAVNCGSYSTQSLTTTGWSKVTCVFTTDATAATNPYMQIRQSDSTARTFYVDNLSVTLSTVTSSPPNVQVGGGSYGGTVTLFTLDKSSSPPVAAGNDVYYGSMYYDTTSGRIQCYQANGWGACGSAPDTFVNLSPEYDGAVLNGTGIGTMTADVCSNQSGVLTINTTLCGSGQALNFYKWTSPQATQQTYSIYLSYQLPGGFKSFQSDSTINLTARVDNTTNAVVTYEMFRSQGGAVTRCYDGITTETQATTLANTWQTVGINGGESTGCGFSTSSANNFVIFKINLKANSNANAYVSTLSFTITNQ